MNIKSKEIINFIIGLTVAIFLGFILNSNFRVFFSTQIGDPTIFTSIVTLLALLVTVRQNVLISNQGVQDRNFAYRLSVKSRFDEMGLIVIAKMLEVEARRVACKSTLEGIKNCIDNGKKYVDGFGISSTDVFNSDSNKASAAIDIYFSNEGRKWNSILDDLNKMGSLALSMLLTYTENDYGKLNTKFISDIDLHIVKMCELDENIANKPEEIRNSVIEMINQHTVNLSRVYY